MKATLLSICLLFACAAAAAAAGGDGKKEEKPRPDLSGTWELDRSKSDFGLFRDRPISKADSTLVISHRGPELRITRTLTVGPGRQETKEFTYYTDGRGETNPMAVGRGRFDTRTKWEGGRVVAHAYYGSSDGYRGNLSDATFKWRLSEDGQTLTYTIQSSFRPSVGDSSVADTINSETRLVYRRVG